MAAQDPGDGAGRHAGGAGNQVWAGPQLGPGGQHPLLELGRGTARARTRAAAPLSQPFPPLRPVPAHPPMRALARHPQLRRDMRDRPAFDHDTTNKQTSAMHRQPGISVTHQDLRVSVKRATPLRPEVFFMIKHPPVRCHQDLGQVQLVGWTEARKIARLGIAEFKAQAARTAGPSGAGATRRNVIRSGIAGLAGAAALTLIPRTASAATPGAGHSVGPAAAADVQRVLNTDTVRLAIQTWGPYQQDVIEVRQGAERVLVFTHEREQDQIFTFVDNSADAQQSSNPTALSMGPAPIGGAPIRFYTTAGIPLCDVRLDAEGNVVAGAVALPEGTVHPDPTGPAVACFIACVRRKVSDSCLTTCSSCATSSGPSKAVYCAVCAVCAGPSGVRCAAECFGR